MSQVKRMSTDIPFILDALQSSNAVEVQVLYHFCFLFVFFFSFWAFILSSMMRMLDTGRTLSQDFWKYRTRARK